MNNVKEVKTEQGVKNVKDVIKSRIVSQIKNELIANPNASAGHTRNTYTR